MTGLTDRCLVQVREHQKAPWRTVPPSCLAVEAHGRATDLSAAGHYYAVRVIHDGRQLLELVTPSAPAEDPSSCPSLS